MELVSIAKEIQNKIRLLVAGRKILKHRAKAKADAIGEHKKELAKTLMQLRNGVEFELEGVKIKNPPASYSREIADGLCWKTRVEMELQDAMYKNAIEGMDSIKAEMNGYQSIFRYLDEVEKDTQKGVPPAR